MCTAVYNRSIVCPFHVNFTTVRLWFCHYRISNHQSMKYSPQWSHTPFCEELSTPRSRPRSVAVWQKNPVSLARQNRRRDVEVWCAAALVPLWYRANLWSDLLFNSTRWEHEINNEVFSLNFALFIPKMIISYIIFFYNWGEKFSGQICLRHVAAMLRITR